MKHLALVLAAVPLVVAAQAGAVPVTTTFYSPQYAPSGMTSGFSFQLTYELGVDQFGGSVHAFSGPTARPVFASAVPAVFDAFAATRCYLNPGPANPPTCTTSPVTRFVIGGAQGGAQTLGDNDFLLTFDLDAQGNILNLSNFTQNQPTLQVTTTTNGVATSYNELLLKGASVVASAVPETSTWASMVFGLGLVGGVLRQRRKVTLQLSRSPISKNVFSGPFRTRPARTIAFCLSSIKG